ncbi:Pyruvate/2-oxoglutarate dehydrogenase complex, dihydrolipoamide dehydrogenase (E3) component [Filimonas lacunae]|uniref:Pyruvate/2-oxoglutarate dehydrogenase complex, dihydrolipoamide dehydrogenase (E3) component n=1 Tax=Filimonas lacunae TaxID=477680 RepID=A0A173MFU6_9BACT|nr:mercuric reductase [Filimonas lacunae]BAV06366.1 PF00070 family, FAD-dependent NAD(P)-disulphide oxidoreductase [Filimonas lacunae]SIT26644.1 Pyruvate/2-oxoglutarate dehydrogenase complex, dihydrolipoamide dehydrogenase (E3) component [Filimonas lacunae]
MKTLDAIVIGAGQGGTPLAKKLAKAGYKTLLVEKRWVGGTCINDGCTPTKNMIAHAAIAQRVRKSEQWGIHTPGMSIDFETIWQHKNKIVNQFRDSSVRGVEATEGLELLIGEASFIGHKAIQVKTPDGQTETYQAESIYINAGARPAIPEITGLSVTPYLTSTTLLELPQIPAHLVILGGSYIALEMAQLFSRLGSRVSIIERSPYLLPKEDADISACIKDILRDEGIAVYTHANVHNVEKHITGGVAVFLDKKHHPEIILGSHLLLALGRTPNTDTLCTQMTRLDIDNEGFIKINSNLQTNISGIYALGDIKGGPAFTHVSYNDYVIILRNLLENKGLNTNNRIIPYCMFTDPQLGRVGITEKEARTQNLPINVYTLPMTKVARAIESGQTQGIMKAVVHKETGKILGATIIGEQGGETITVLQMAMLAGMTCEDLRYQMFAHPLYAESVNNLFMQEPQ